MNQIIIGMSSGVVNMCGAMIRYSNITIHGTPSEEKIKVTIYNFTQSVEIKTLLKKIEFFYLIFWVIS